MRLRISKRTIDTLQPGSTRYVVWDTLLPGFSCRVEPNGKRVYYFYYRTKMGQQRRPRIGVHGVITADQARDKAAAWALVVQGGGDPAADEAAQIADAMAEAANPHPANPTMADLAKWYIDEHGPRLKRRSLGNAVSLWNRHILPAMGRKKVRTISNQDVAALHASMSIAQPTNANRALEVLQKAFELAEIWRWRLVGTNPCKGVKPNKEKKRKRYLTMAEAAALGTALDSFAARGGTAWVVAMLARMLVFTGARLNELMQAEWAAVDWERGVLRLADTKSNEEQEIILTMPALGLLEVMRKLADKGHPYIFPGRVHKRPLQYPYDYWAEILAAAGIKDLHMHDLRHSFASVVVATTGSVANVTGLLRHANSQTSDRYSHLMDGPLRAAAEATAGRIGAMLEGNVVSMDVVRAARAGRRKD